MQPLTRREFLRSLWPQWPIMRGIRPWLVGGCAVLLASWFLYVLLSQTFVQNAWTIGFLVAVGAAIFILRKLGPVLSRAIAAASEDFRAFVAALRHGFDIAVAMTIGAWLYARWNAGTDITPTLITLACYTLFRFLRGAEKA